MKPMKPIAPFFALLLFTALALAQAPADPKEPIRLAPSTAYQLVLEKFMNERDDLVITLFMREGKPVHAYAITPAVDQSIHRVDIFPAAPIEYLVDGQKFVPPSNLKGDYDYKKPEFLKYREQYEAKKVVMRNYDLPAPLEVAGPSASGVLDLFLDSPDRRKQANFRVKLDLKANDSGFAGRFQAHDYAPQDETFSPRGTPFTGAARMVERKDHWDHRPELAFPAGANWPQQHGPTLTGSAIDSEHELVDHLADARLLWVADMPIPGGRGGIPRSPFGFFPINNSGLGLTQFSAPIVVDGKVYLSVPYVDEQGIQQAAEGLKNHPRIIRGLDPRAMAGDLNLMRDTLFCIDAQTGRVLWMFQDPRKMGLIGESKSGRGLTAAHHEGKIIFRGQTSLYAVDAQTGRLLWQNNGEKGVKGGEPGYGFGAAQSWSTDHSPVVIDGVIIVRINDTPKAEKNAAGVPAEYTTLMGIDPNTGKPLWRASRVTGRNGIPTSIVLEGKTYIIATYEGDGRLESLPPDQIKPEQIGLLSLIDPKTGQIIWQKPVVGGNALYPIVWNDIIATNVDRTVAQGAAKADKNEGHLGALRITKADATPIWAQPRAAWMGGRVTPISHQGYFISDTRTTGLQAFKADTGEVIAKFPHIYHMTHGSHNWTWMIASNGRVIVSGENLMMFRLQDNRMEQLPGALRVDLASGYVCPIRPAMADGRLFIRTGDGLACYDLRKPAGRRQVDTLRLQTDDLALGMAGKGSADLQIRLVDQQPQTVSVRFPAFQQTGVPRPYGWGGPGPIRWRDAPANGLEASANGLKGDCWVRVNDHNELWRLDLQKSDGDTFSGTITRNIPKARETKMVEGQAEATVETLADQRTRHAMRLAGAAINGRSEPADVNVFLETLPDGRILAYASGGRINQSSFEVDPTGLQLDAGRISGPLMILFHSDRFQHAHPEQTTALAARYTVDLAARTDGSAGLSGTFKGELGIEHQRTVPARGQYAANQEPTVSADSASTEAPPVPQTEEEPE